MISLVKSIFLGSEGKYQIGSLRINFGDHPPKALKAKTISDIAYDFFTRVIPWMTLHYMQSFAYGVGLCLTHRIYQNPVEKLCFVRGNVTVLQNNGQNHDYEDDATRNKIYRIANYVHGLFQLVLFAGAIVLKDYVTKPVAVFVAGLAIFSISNKIKHPPFTPDVDRDFKRASYLAAAYALSLFAAYKLI